MFRRCFLPYCTIQHSWWNRIMNISLLAFRWYDSFCGNNHIFFFSFVFWNFTLMFQDKSFVVLRIRPSGAPSDMESWILHFWEISLHSFSDSHEPYVFYSLFWGLLIFGFWMSWNFSWLHYLLTITFYLVFYFDFMITLASLFSNSIYLLSSNFFSNFRRWWLFFSLSLSCYPSWFQMICFFFLMMLIVALLKNVL